MKTKIYKPLGLLLVGAVVFGSTFTSCKSKQEVSNVKNETLIEVYCSGPDYRSDKNNFRANSIGESLDQGTARKKAMSNAKADLAGLIQTVIKGTTDNYVNSREFNNVEEVEERFESLTREVLNQQLNNIKVICEKQTITKEGRYKTYVAIEMSVDALEDALNSRLSKDQRLKVDYDYEKYKETFDKEMEKLENGAY
ncbi:MAG: LPP20 family lipoprotein [Bacteroidales bacterium]|nr:LPP20 family lipoprotein [Bacteroidales bacterium]